MAMYMIVRQSRRYAAVTRDHGPQLFTTRKVGVWTTAYGRRLLSNHIHQVEKISDESKSSDGFLNIMPDPPMICFRRAKNLKDHLVRSKLRKEQDAVGGRDV